MQAMPFNSTQSQLLKAADQYSFMFPSRVSMSLPLPAASCADASSDHLYYILKLRKSRYVISLLMYKLYFPYSRKTNEVFETSYYV
jgi:hypothetical protein